MSMDSEISNYLSTRYDGQPKESLEFLIKLWRSERLSSHEKFDCILKHFTQHTIPRLNDVDILKVQEFLRLTHPNGSVSEETQQDLVKSVIKELKKSPSIHKINVALEIASLDSYRDFFKQNLPVYAKLFKIILQNVIELNDSMTAEESSELKSKVVDGLFLLVNVDGYETIFLDQILIPLSELNKDDPSKHELLLRNVFFHEVGSMESKLTIFESGLKNEQRLILIESFIALHKSKLVEIARLFAALNKKFETLDNDEFLLQIGQLLGLIMKHEIEYSSLKKQDSELFDDISERIISSLSESQESMPLHSFLENVVIFFSCDPFLLEKSLYSMIIDCMFKEKSTKEIQSFEKLMVAVLKVYGKDLSEFMVKFLKKLDKKLGKFQVPKMKKRKLVGGESEESTPNKKRKTSGTSSKDIYEDLVSKSRFWPDLAMLEFSEICGGMNVAQSTKMIGVLNGSLVAALDALKESKNVTENALFKINMLSTMLSSILEYSRIMEQMMSKTADIVELTKLISATLEVFGQVILNVEYNSRLVGDYLSLMKNFDSFLMLFSYHYDTDVNHEFDSVFTENHLQGKEEWEIIQQRIKSFGKFDELNNLNLLIIQQNERNQLFGVSKKNLDITSILDEESQIEAIFKKPEMRFFVINSMNEKQVEIFVDFITNTDNIEIVNHFTNVVSSNLSLTQKFTKSLTAKKGKDDKVLAILSKLPLWCAADEVKQAIFQRVLDSKTKTSQLLEVVEKMCQNDGFKSCLKDFKMKQITDKFGSNPNVLEMILKNSAKKMSQQVLENFSWILKKGDDELVKILSAVVNEINLTPGSGATADLIGQFKKQLVEKVLSIDCNTIATLKMVKDNYSLLDQKLQGIYSEKLLSFVKSEANRSKDDIKFMNSILKDAKKLNLSDEIKRECVEVLQKFTKTISNHKLSSIDSDFTTESETLLMLNVYKSDFLNEYLNNLIEHCNYSNHSQLIQLCQIFKLTVESKDTKDDDKKSVKFIEKYLNFLRNYANHNESAELTPESLSVNVAILETNNAIMKDNKLQLSTTQVDQLLSFAANTRLIENLDDIQQFCKYMNVLGETLFIVSVVRQSYFKDRSPHYFNIYKSFVERIYFFKNGSNDEFSPVEVSSLLKLTLQAENIIKTALKNHEKALKSVNCYIASSVVNVLVQNPKTLSLGGNKFKVNIKNICHHLLSTFDEKTRKYVYRVADETTQEVYNEIFGEMRRKS